MSTVREFSLELNSWEPHESSESGRKIRRSVTCSKERRVRKFHVVVERGRQRNVPKGVLHVQVFVLLF